MRRILYLVALAASASVLGTFPARLSAQQGNHNQAKMGPSVRPYLAAVTRQTFFGSAALSPDVDGPAPLATTSDGGWTGGGTQEKSCHGYPIGGRIAGLALNLVAPYLSGYGAGFGYPGYYGYGNSYGYPYSYGYGNPYYPGAFGFQRYYGSYGGYNPWLYGLYGSFYRPWYRGYNHYGYRGYYGGLGGSRYYAPRYNQGFYGGGFHGGYHGGGFHGGYHGGGHHR